VVDDELFKYEVKNYVQEKNITDPDEYLFDCYEQDEAKRTHIIGVRINKRIKESKVLEKNSEYQFSSHMFRKTKANSIYQELNREARERARRAIGQASGSSAIENYIESNVNS
jgi:hypothetical protein